MFGKFPTYSLLPWSFEGIDELFMNVFVRFLHQIDQF